MDDDFGMELLVAGNIISLNLPVRLVWECVWRPSLAEGHDNEEDEDEDASDGLDLQGTRLVGDIEVMGPPMVVTYRLQACPTCCTLLHVMCG